MDMLLYSVGFKHQYSDIFVGGAKQEEKENQAKIAFAFAWGIISFRSPGLYGAFYASQFNRDINGNFIKDEQGKKYTYLSHVTGKMDCTIAFGKNTMHFFGIRINR